MCEKRKPMLEMFLMLLFIFLVSNQNSYAQWSKQTTGLPTSSAMGYAPSIDASDESTAVCVTRSGVSNIFRTVNGGVGWSQLSAPEEAGYIWDVSIIDSSHIWVCDGDGKIFATGDGGSSWVLQFSDSTKTEFMNYIEMFDISNGVAMGDGVDLTNNPAGPPLFLNTSDGGAQWISVNDSAIGGYSGDTWRRLDFVSLTVGYFFESGINPQVLLKTEDGGKSWIQTNYADYVQVMSFFDENIGLIISGAGHVERTVDGGETWESFSSPHSGWGNDIEFSPDDPAMVWMTDHKKLYFSSDTGRTWVTQMSSCEGSDIVFVDSWTGWVACSNGVYFTNSGGTTDIPDEFLSQPHVFELEQNFPNPFNASTTILYRLKNDAEVSLSVFNLVGQKIAVLINSKQSPGSHHVQWHTRGLPSGIYYYRLEAGDYQQTRKLILLR